MKKADGVIIGAILLVCAALFLFSRFAGQKQTGPISAEIYVAGQLAQDVPLSGDAAYELAIGEGKVVLLVEPDGVSVASADCASQTCVHTGKITLPGQIITCLPNRVIVKLTGETDVAREVDVVAK